MGEQIDIDINVNMNNADDVDELTSKLEAANAEVERLTDELAQVEMGEVDGDVEALEEELANSTAEAEALQAELEEIGSTDVDPNVDVDDLTGSMSVLEGGMLLSIGQQMQGLGSNAEGMAQQMNASSISVGQLATMTGVAEPQMVSLINNISNATFPNNEAMMYVKNLSQMGVEADNFAKSATEIDIINDAFGMGAQTTNAMATELAVLGVDMNNVSSSYNALAYANANTKGGMENFYTFLRKYDADLNQLGYDVDQTAVIIAGATQKYGGGKAALSGLSTALKEADGDSRKLEEALGLETGALDHASEITGEYEGQVQALADEEAEHKTILDQAGAAWEDVSLSLSGFLAPGASVLGLIGQMGSFGMTIKGLKEIGSTLGGVQGAMGTAKTMMDALRNSESITEGVRVALSIATGAEATAEGGAAAAKGAAIGPTTGLAIAENSLLLPLLLIVGAVVAVIAIMWYLYNTNETVRNGINWLIAQIQAFVNMLIPVAQAIMNFVTTAVSNMGKLPGLIWSIFLRVVSFVGQWAANMLSRGVSAAQSFVSNVSSVFGGIVGRITSALSGVVNAITQPFKDAWSYVEPYVNKIKEGLDIINPFSGFSGYSSFEGYMGLDDTLNGTISNISTNSNSNSNLTVNNNFNGLVEESAADYIVNAVNDRLRREKLLRGA